MYGFWNIFIMRYSEILGIRNVAIFRWSNDVLFWYSERLFWYFDIWIFIPDYRTIGILEYSDIPEVRKLRLSECSDIPIFRYSNIPKYRNSAIFRKSLIYIVPRLRNSENLVKWRYIPIFNFEIQEYLTIFWKSGNIAIFWYSDIPILQNSRIPEFQNSRISEYRNFLEVWTIGIFWYSNIPIFQFCIIP